MNDYLKPQPKAESLRRAIDVKVSHGIVMKNEVLAPLGLVPVDGDKIEKLGVENDWHSIGLMVTENRPSRWKNFLRGLGFARRPVIGELVRNNNHQRTSETQWLIKAYCPLDSEYMTILQLLQQSLEEKFQVVVHIEQEKESPYEEVHLGDED